MMNCEEVKSLLTKYLLGDLDEAQASEVRAHIEKCEDCSAEAAEIEPTLDLLRDAFAETAPASAKLDAGKYAEIYTEQSNRSGRVVSFLTGDYPVLRRLAAVLVICFIFALLAGMLLPALNSSRERARRVSSANKLRQLQTAVDMYKMDNNGEAPASMAAVKDYISGGAVVGPLSGEELKYDFSGNTDGIVAVDEGAEGAAVLYGDGRVEYEEKPKREMCGWFKMGEVVAGASKSEVQIIEPEQVEELDEIQEIREPARAGSMAGRAKIQRSDMLATEGVEFSVEDDLEASDPFAAGETVVHYGAVSHESRSAVAPGKKEKGESEALAKKRERAKWNEKAQSDDNGHATREVELQNAKEHIRKLETEIRRITIPGGGAVVPAIVLPETEEMPVIEEVPALQPMPEEDLSELGFDRKSPVILRGIYGSRSPGVRGSALGGKQPAKPEALDAPVGGFSFAKAQASPEKPVKARKKNSVPPSTSDAGQSIAMFAAEKQAESEVDRYTAEGHEDDARQATLEKLKRIVIPEIDFRNANLRDTLEFLQEQTVAFDKDESNSGKDGVNISLRLNEEAALPEQPKRAAPMDPFAASARGSASGDTDVPLITFSARSISVQEALDIVTSVANLKYRVDEKGKVRVVPIDNPEQEIVHKTYDLLPGVAASIQTSGAESDTQGEAWKDFFAAFGVGWPLGAEATYLPDEDRIIVANTPDNLQMFEKILSVINSEQEKAAEKEVKEQTRFKAYGVNPVINVSQNAFSTFSIDVDTASYTLTRNYIISGQLPPAESVRTEEFVNYFDYAYTAPEHRTFAVYAEAAPSKFGRGQHLLKIGVKGRRLGREEQRRAVLTFLIDTSGSMEKPDRIGLVKKSLRMLVERLNEDDLISIVQYDSRARLVLGHTAARRKGKILEAIDSLQCSGSTNLEQGLHKAYEVAAKGFVSKGENRVLILSDGVANLGNLDADALLAKVERYRKQGVFCSVFGVGMGTYDDVMLETLANKGDGNYAYLDSEEEAKRLFVDDLAATLNTIAKDVKIQVEFNERLVKTYRQLGYENRQLTKEQFRDDTVDAGEVGSGQSVTALYELDMEKSISRRLAPEPVAVVRVRYRRTDSGAIEEIEIPVTFRDFVNEFNKAGAKFRLAACAAEFAEILRGSPYAKGSDYRDVSSALRPVALELDLDQRVQDFLRLTVSAPGMARGK